MQSIMYPSCLSSSPESSPCSINYSQPPRPIILTKTLLALLQCFCIRKLQRVIVLERTGKGQRLWRDKTVFRQSMKRYVSSAKCSKSSVMEDRQLLAISICKLSPSKKKAKVSQLPGRKLFCSSSRFKTRQARTIWQTVWQLGATVSLRTGGNCSQGSKRADLIQRNFSSNKLCPFWKKFLYFCRIIFNQILLHCLATMLPLCSLSRTISISQQCVKQKLLSTSSAISTKILALTS